MSGQGKEPVRVLFVGPYPPPYAGPENAMKTLLESCVKETFSISFLKTNVRKDNASKGRFDFSMVASFFVFMGNLFRSLAKHRPALVYYFVTATRLGWIGRDIWCIFVSKVFGAKVVIHMRAGHFKDNYKAMDGLSRGLIRFACKRVDRALVQADCLSSQFEGLVEPSKIHTLYNAVDTNVYNNNDVHEYDAQKVLFMGHLSFAKGYCDLIRVIPAVVNNNPEVLFQFAGTPIIQERNVFFNQATGERIHYTDPQKVYAECLQGRLEKHHEYLGVLHGEEKIKALRNCAVFVLPSYSEGFSMAVLEALAIGKPIVCTPVGALKEVIRDGVNGLLVPPGDIASLETAISKLLGDPKLRARMALENQRYVEDHFSQDAIGSKLSEHFNSVLQKSS